MGKRLDAAILVNVDITEMQSFLLFRQEDQSLYDNYMHKDLDLLKEERWESSSTTERTAFILI